MGPKLNDLKERESRVTQRFEVEVGGPERTRCNQGEKNWKNGSGKGTDGL